MTAQTVISDMLLTTYERAGRGPSKFDCWGMVIETCKRMGWPVPFDPIEASSNPRELLRIFRTHTIADQWKLCAPDDGAVAFFGRFGAARHAGIVIDGGILHTREGIGPVHEPLPDFQDVRVEYAQWVG